MDRQTIMETNKSLRTIKTELETLLEKGVIDDAAFDAIHAVLPAETPLRGVPPNARSNSSTPMQPTSAASTPPPPRASSNTAATAGPPSYEDTPAPGVPARSGKPVLSHARALYRYTGLDPRDLNLEKDDEILVHEHMNADWWFGRNQRTGAEGIFPQNYVLVQQQQQGGKAYAPQPTYGYPQQQQQQQQGPYDSSVPPMAVAEGGGQGGQGAGGGKVGEYGKKFGKKLGNAAVFGAGATIGSNLVNSIF